MSSKQTTKRLFMKTSHDALHKPGCGNLKRLKVPPLKVWVDPNETFPGTIAECCWRYGSWTAYLYGWRYDESGELFR